MPKYKHSCPKNYELDFYSGCPFNCSYCIAQSRHELNSTAVYSIADLDREINRSDQADIPFYLSPWTDPYQDLEKKSKLTRYTLSKLFQLNRKFFVVTKSCLVSRDIEFFQQNPRSFVAVSLNSLDQSILNRIEFKLPTAEQRQTLVADLIKAKVKTVVKIDPIIPGITDGISMETLINWIIKVKPFAVTTETVRINNKIAENIMFHLSSIQYKKFINHYPPLDHHPKHPHLEYRIKLFNWMKQLFAIQNIPISFCTASLPIRLTNYDCRGGF